ncbi:MAG: hypothetical protein ABH857_02285 [Elusimicrobiota bacterium]
MKQRLLLLIISFFTLSVVSGAEPVNNLKGSYFSFSKHFKAREFYEAAKYLSSADHMLYEDIDLGESGIAFDESNTLEKELERMWMFQFDAETKKAKAEELQTLTEAKLAYSAEAMDQPIVDDAEDWNELGLSNDNMALDLEKELVFSVAVSDIFGNVIEERIQGNYALIICRSNFTFPNDKIKELKSVLNKEKDTPAKVKEYRRLKLNVLTEPTVCFFIKEHDGWKMMLFSKSSFPFSEFKKTLLKYMSGANFDRFSQQEQLSKEESMGEL